MNEREPIRPELYSAIEVLGEQVILAPTTDRIDLFPGLGYALLKAMNEEGKLDAYHMDSDTGETLAERTGLPLIVREYITPEENDSRLGYLSQTVTDDWLNREQG